MILFGQVVLGFYGVLLIGGGVMGYRTAGSRVSLFAGAIAGGLCIGGTWLSVDHPQDGFTLGGLVAFMLTGVFINRFAKTRKLMPSGVVLALSLVVGVLMLWLVQSLTAVGPALQV